MTVPGVVTATTIFTQILTRIVMGCRAIPMHIMEDMAIVTDAVTQDIGPTDVPSDSE